MVGRGVALMMSLWCFSAQAAIPPLYQKVAAQHGIPASVLYSLALGESKTQLQSGAVRPWPWTLNVKGQSYFYATYPEACQALHGFLKHTQMVDIGLTQQNWRWQKDHFNRPCEVFDPTVNLNHAAVLLNEGMRKHGSWVKAAGYFHRPGGGEPARRYEATFARHLQQWSPSS
ncbi:hypothetical protein [Vibrio sp. R78045]|uniref:hypothetical protein n=1 Tax=Vibrio sp. R78045 TaxID=3093868 RepID=UPI0036F3D46A